MTLRPVTELVARASAREVVCPADGKSTSSFERVSVDGQRYFLKRLSPATDWIMRVTGDHVHRPYLIWQAGIMDRVPACIDHTVVAMEIDGDGLGAVCSMLMRDVGGHLVPEGDTIVALSQHEGFIDHLAQLCATFWGFDDTVGGLTTMEERLRFFDPANVVRELAVTDPPGPIVAADAGWKRLPERSPFLYELAQVVWDDPSILTTPLAETPITFLHGGRNLVWRPASSAVTYDMLVRKFGNRSQQYARFVAPQHGHQDLLMGNGAVDWAYPKIVEHLVSAAGPAPKRAGTRSKSPAPT